MNKNVVVVVLDALRADRVGACGGRALTPNIDELASSGTTFTNAYSVINTTDPAMTSLHTGRHPLSHGVLNHGDRVTQTEKQRIESIQTLPEILSEHGYDTLKFGRALGRWHTRGFSRYPEPTEKSFKVKTYDKLDRVDSRLARLGSWISSPLEPILTSIGRISRYEKGGSDEANSIEQFLDSTKKMSGFYGLVHLMDTHAPYEPDSAVVDKLIREFEYDGQPVGDIVEELGEDSVTGNNLHNLLKREGDTETITTARIKARYDATVREVDMKVGELIAGLKRRNQLRDTMLLILSDHGESLDEHGIFFDHHGLYEQTLKIPLIVYHPDIERESRVIEEPVQITDIFPTVLDYLGVETSKEYDGHSLLPSIHRGEVTPREAVFAEEAHTQRRRMIRTPEWKYIYLLEGDTKCRYCKVEHAAPEELYNLVSDPEEEENLLQGSGDKGKYHDRVNHLTELEDEYLRRVKRDVTVNSREVRYEDEKAILDRLEKLGYR